LSPEVLRKIEVRCIHPPPTIDEKCSIGDAENLRILSLFSLDDAFDRAITRLLS
jgi:hypothetical protein